MPIFISKFCILFKKNKTNLSQDSNKKISNSILYALNNQNSNNWSYQLQILRDVLTFNNNSFIDPGEINPIDLIEYIIKSLHIENNRIKHNYSKLFSLDEDPDILDKEKIQKKFLANFAELFKSFISDLFYGSLEITKLCRVCNIPKFYYETFFYITLDVSQSIKWGNNITT